LPGANLSGATLRGADLSGVNLYDADLHGADLILANLSGAQLGRAVLSGAHVSEADLRGANLSANLSSADLREADLRDADLTGANLTAAQLAYANLTRAKYAPASEPPYPFVAGIKGLSKVRIPSGEEAGLVQLRKLLQDAGLRVLEREATYSIERARTSEMTALPSVIGAIFRRAAFELPTAYGLHPFRALFLIMLIWLFCVPIYCRSIVDDPGGSQQGNGIYRILPADRVVGLAAEPEIKKEPEVIRLQAADLWTAVPAAVYFSLLSAVDIGFQQFTPGDWIRRLQPHEYTLHPRVGLGSFLDRNIC